MIYLYSGTPGSGKSYHATIDILNKLKRKKKNRVISNSVLNVKQGQNFLYVDNSEITIDFLVSYAEQHHVIGIEGQTLVVIDEAQCIFNSRDWNSGSSSRLDWIKFFSQHRKLGFNFILIAQFDRMLDRQIRCLIEYDIKHLKINNGFFGFLPFTCFIAVTKWYGQNMRLGHEVIVLRKKVAKLYNSYALFDTFKRKIQPSKPTAAEGEGPALAGGDPNTDGEPEQQDKTAAG